MSDYLLVDRNVLLFAPTQQSLGRGQGGFGGFVGVGVGVGVGSVPTFWG